MSSEAPPTYNVSIFIPSYWADQTTSGFDKTYADNHYLKFPIGQGTEYIPDLVVSGTTTLGGTSASSLNMTNGNITSVNNINVSTINGSAYPQAAGINAVLATGNTATDKSIILDSTAGGGGVGGEVRLNGDYIELFDSALTNSTKLRYYELLMTSGSNRTTTTYGGYTVYSNYLTPLLDSAFYGADLMEMAGSSSNILNRLTPTSSEIADGTYTATLISNALSLFTNAVETTRNAITNTGMTITGSAITTTNTLTSLTNTITDATRTISMGISSSIATFKALASSGGNSSVITPTDVSVYSTDGSTTTTYSRLTSNIFTQYGSSTSSNVMAIMTSSGTSGLRLVTNQTTNYPLTANTLSIENNGGAVTAGSIGFRRTIANQANSVNNVLGAVCFTGKNTTTVELEFARISSSIKAVGTGLADGAILFQTAVNSTLTNMMEINGDVGKVVAYQPIIIDPTGGSASTTFTNISSTQLNITGSSAARVTQVNNPPNSGTTTTGYCFYATSDQNNYSTSNFDTGFMLLNSTSAGTGTTGCINTIIKRGKTVAPDDCIGLTSYVAVGAGAPSTNREFARIASFCKTNTSATDTDGSLVLSARVNTALADMIELNGAEDQINAFKPLDMNNNSIVSSTGGITLDTTGSSGTGVITLNTKNGTAGTGTGLVLSGNTLTTDAPSGGSSGHHLCLYLPHPTTGVSTLYKIDLKT